MTSVRREIINLDKPDTWPSDLLAVLDEHHDAFRSHEVGPLSAHFDAAVYSIVDALQVLQRCRMALYPPRRSRGRRH